MNPHTRTPSLRVSDSRTLIVREVSYCRSEKASTANERITRHTWNLAGHPAADWDPRLWEKAATANSRKTPSLSGQTLLDESVDAGWRLALSGADGQSVERWDGRGSYSWTDYDDCLRPVSVTERLIDAQPNVVERFTYGDASALCAEHNQCGRLIRHDDPAGTLCAQAFGLAGSVLIENRRFLQTDEQPDRPLDSGQRDALLEPGTGHTTTTVFDAAASLIFQTDAVGNRTEHLYTVGGLLRKTRLKLNNAEHAQTLISDLHYNPDGQLERERLGNGVISEKTYEAETGRLTRILSSRADNTVLQDLNYRHDPVGNVVEIEDAAQAIRFFANQRIDPVSRYRYDTLYQLIEATGREVSTGASYGPALPTLQNLPQDPNQLSNYTQRYDYDAGGNLLEMRHIGAQSFTRKMLIAPDCNRSLPEGDVDPNFEKGFDANGNLQQLIRGQDLTWDLRNQLRSVTAVERENGSNDEERYVYDSGGQRCRKIRRALTKSRMLVGEVRYLKALELRTELTGEALQVSTIQTGRNNVRVLHWPGGKPEGIANNQIRYSLSDHLGSSTLELDDKGQLISQESYYPFGGTSRWAARSAVEAKYKTIRYSGKERDASGLYYYGFRYYAPWLQRWVNTDPLGSEDGLNLYKFVGNSPNSYLDTDGRVARSINTPHGLAYFDTGLEARLLAKQEANPDKLDIILNSYDHTIVNDFTITSASRHKMLERDEFTNVFKPHHWFFKDNWKRLKTEPIIHANEITMAQYLSISQKGNFVGTLPSVITRSLVTNKQVISVAERYPSGSNELMEQFFKSTQNGKSTQRILNDFGLRPTRVETEYTKFKALNVHVYVEPTDIPVSPTSSYSHPNNTQSRFSVSVVKPPSRFTVTPAETNAPQATTATSRFSVSAVNVEHKSRDPIHRPFPRTISPSGQGH